MVLRVRGFPVHPVKMDSMSLGDTDKEILQLLSEGKTAKEIAPLVCKDKRTVEYRVKKIMRALNSKNAVQAVALAIKNNLI